MSAVATASGVSGIAIMAAMAGIAVGFLVGWLFGERVGYWRGLRENIESWPTDYVGMGEPPRLDGIYKEDGKP